MITQHITWNGTLSALVIACAMTAVMAQPAVAQTAVKLDCTGCVKSKQVRNNGIRSADIRDGTVKNVDLAVDAVGGSKIQPDAVTGAKVQDSSLTGSDLAAQSIPAEDLSNGAGGDFAVNQTTGLEDFILGDPTVYRSFSLTAPSAGQVVLNASGYFVNMGAAGMARCSISKDTAMDDRTLTVVEIGSKDSRFEAFGITWGESVAAGTQVWNLVCDTTDGTPPILENPALTAIFVPTRY